MNPPQNRHSTPRIDGLLMADRLQKLLAHAGLGSRRELETWIVAGRVKLNGKVAKLGDTASVRDKVSVDGKPIDLAAVEAVPRRVLAYKKHTDQIVTRRDPEGRQTVFEKLPRVAVGRWLAVGRLDINTSGVLLLTTDGELKRRLEHPSFEIEREYAVRVHGQVTDGMLKRLSQGVELEDGFARFDAVRRERGREHTNTNQWFHVLLHEGRNRLVRRLWDSQGVEVSRLIRVGFGPVPLPTGIKAGGFRELTRDEVKVLARMVDL